MKVTALATAGDYCFVKQQGIDIPAFICPRCLRINQYPNHLVLQRSPLTIRPSLWCEQLTDGKPCDWSGVLTDGVIEEKVY